MLSNGDGTIDHAKDNVVWLPSGMLICIVIVLMGYLLEYESKSGIAFEFVEGSILTVARLDDFIATMVVSLCSG